jgi:hypothetical protein
MYCAGGSAPLNLIHTTRSTSMCRSDAVASVYPGDVIVGMTRAWS